MISKDHRTTESSEVINIRNNIQHIDKEIKKGVKGSLTIKLSEDGTFFDVNGNTLFLDDLVFELNLLWKKILNILGVQ